MGQHASGAWARCLTLGAGQVGGGAFLSRWRGTETWVMTGELAMRGLGPRRRKEPGPEGGGGPAEEGEGGWAGPRPPYPGVALGALTPGIGTPTEGSGPAARSELCLDATAVSQDAGGGGRGGRGGVQARRAAGPGRAVDFLTGLAVLRQRARTHTLGRLSRGLWWPGRRGCPGAQWRGAGAEVLLWTHSVRSAFLRGNEASGGRSADYGAGARGAGQTRSEVG